MSGEGNLKNEKSFQPAMPTMKRKAIPAMISPFMSTAPSSRQPAIAVQVIFRLYMVTEILQEFIRVFQEGDLK
jgi:hypothetical protein